MCRKLEVTELQNDQVPPCFSLETPRRRSKFAMLIVSSSFILAVIAFLTVNSLLSILKLMVCTGYPVAKRLLRGDSENECSDLSVIFAAAESFNTGVLTESSGDGP